MKGKHLLVGLLLMAPLISQAVVAEEWDVPIYSIIIRFANENEKAFPNVPIPPPPGYTLTKTSTCIYPEITALNEQYELVGGRQLWRSDGAAVKNIYLLVFPDTVQIDDVIDDYGKASVAAGVVANTPLEFLGQPIVMTPNDYWYNYTFPYDDHDDCQFDASHYRQWTLPATRYDRAWAISQGDSTVVVAVMDTGLDRQHPEIAENVWRNQVEWNGPSYIDLDGNGYAHDYCGYDFADQDDNVLHDTHWWQRMTCQGPYDPDSDCECCRAWNEKWSPVDREAVCGGSYQIPENCTLEGWGVDRHGTVMSSIISAKTDNATSPPHPGDIAAITTCVKILPLKVGSRTPTHKPDVTGNLADAIEAMNYLYDMKVGHGVNVRVLNMSVTMDGHGDLASTAPSMIHGLLDDLSGAGIVLVGGAGNWGNETGRNYPVYPCRDPLVLCTACLHDTGVKLESSQYGGDDREDDNGTDFNGIDACGYGTSPLMYDVLRQRNAGDPAAPPMVLGWEPWNHLNWSFCLNGAPAGPGEFFQVESQWHIAGITPMLTSGSTAQASGLAALVASAHPEYTVDQIEAAIKRGAVNVDALNDSSLAGRLGAGKMDAYRTLTLWGTISEDLTLSGQVWISGDVTIPEGRSLTIAPGTLVRVAPDNELQAGTPNAVHVYGTLQVSGTSAEPVVFRSWALNRARGDWLGLRVYASGSASLDHCTIMHAQTGIVATGPTVLQNCVIDSCAYGVAGAGTAVTLGPLVSIRNTTADAVWMQAGTLTLQGLMVLGSGANGVNAAAGTVLMFGSGMNTIQDCATNGFLLTDITAPVTLQSLFIGDCGTAGVRVVGAAGMISGAPQFGSTGLAAIYCDGASPALTDLAVSAPGTGVFSANGANPNLRYCSMSDCAYALLVDPLSRADAGTYQDYGHNHFDRCTMYAATLNQEWPLMMVGNCWEGGVNPRSTKFGVGQIIYLPASCQ